MRSFKEQKIQTGENKLEKDAVILNNHEFKARMKA